MTGNSQNRGLFQSDIRNSGDTIRSIRNQFLFIPIKDFVVMQRLIPSVGLMQEAYARDCVQLERSVTVFDPLRTVFSVDADVNLNDFGLAGVIPAGQNLLSNQELRDRFLSQIQNNSDIHSGLDGPITVSPQFLAYFKGQRRIFTIVMTSTTGDVLSASANVWVDVNG